MFHYELKNQGQKMVVAFHGDLDIEATEIFEEQLIQQFDDCKELSIDFTHVPFVDSSGIGLLISLINSLRENGIQIVVVNVTEDVKQVFSLLQLPDIVGQDVFVDN